MYQWDKYCVELNSNSHRREQCTSIYECMKKMDKAVSHLPARHGVLAPPGQDLLLQLEYEHDLGRDLRGLHHPVDDVEAVGEARHVVVERARHHRERQVHVREEGGEPGVWIGERKVNLIQISVILVGNRLVQIVEKSSAARSCAIARKWRIWHPLSRILKLHSRIAQKAKNMAHFGHSQILLHKNVYF